MRVRLLTFLIAASVLLGASPALAEVRPGNENFFPVTGGRVDNGGENDEIISGFSVAPKLDQQLFNIRFYQGSSKTVTKKIQFKLKGFVSIGKGKRRIPFSEDLSDAFIFKSEDLGDYYLAAQKNCVGSAVSCANSKYRVTLLRGTPPDGVAVEDEQSSTAFLADDETPKQLEQWLNDYTEYDYLYGGFRVKDKNQLTDPAGTAKLEEATDSLTGDVLGGALNSVLNKVSELAGDTIRFAGSLVKENGILDSRSISRNEGIQSAWSLLRNVANLFFLLILLVIAFGNVSRFNIEYYTIRALLPKFIAAVVLVNISFFLCLVIIDSADVLTQAFRSLALGSANQADYAIIFDSFGSLGVGIGTTLAAFVVVLFALAAGIFLWAVLLVRLLMVWFLVIVSPLAFIANVLPATSSLNRSWWNQFIRFVFMAPMIALILKVGEVIVLAAGGTGGVAGTIQNRDLLLTPMLAAFVVILAAIIPTMLGGKLMAAAGGYIRKGGALVGGAAYRRTKPYATDALGKAPVLGAGSRLNFDREGNLTGLAATRAGRFLGAGRLGTNKARFDRGIMAADKMDMNKYTNSELALLMNTRAKNSPAGMAAARELAARGSMPFHVDARTGRVRAEDQRLFDKYATDSKFVGNVRSNQPGFLIRSPSRGIQALGLSGVRNADVIKMAGWGGSTWTDPDVLRELAGTLSTQRVIAGLYDAESNEKVRNGLTRRLIPALSTITPARNPEEQRRIDEIRDVITDYTSGTYNYSPEPWREAHGLTGAPPAGPAAPPGGPGGPRGRTIPRTPTPPAGPAGSAPTGGPTAPPTTIPASPSTSAPLRPQAQADRAESRSRPQDIEPPGIQTRPAPAAPPPPPSSSATDLSDTDRRNLQREAESLDQYYIDRGITDKSERDKLVFTALRARAGAYPGFQAGRHDGALRRMVSGLDHSSDRGANDE